MLTLKRQECESITIDYRIEMKILKNGKRIRIGIAALKNVGIVRTEINE